MRKATAPHRAAAREALRAFGATPARLISHGENTIFGVQEHRWVVRVHRPDYHTTRAIEGELRLMTAYREGGFRVPEVIAARDGSVLQHSQGFRVTVLERFHGRILRMPGKRRTQILGETLAHLHQLAGTFDDDFDRPRWTLQAIIGPKAAWGSMEHGGMDPVLAGELRSALGVRLADVAGNVPLHFDLHAGNIIWMGDTPGLIDWDDSGNSAPLFDLVIPYKRVPPAKKRHLLQGYGRPIDSDRLDTAALAIDSRILGWLHNRREVPGFPALHAKRLVQFSERARTWLDGLN